MDLKQQVTKTRVSIEGLGRVPGSQAVWTVADLLDRVKRERPDHALLQAQQRPTAGSRDSLLFLLDVMLAALDGRAPSLARAS